MILVEFLEKGVKVANLANFGVLRRGIGIPHSSVGPHHGMAVEEACTSLGLRCDEGLRRGVATVHNMEISVFCLVLLFCYSEDLSIGLMRTL